MPQEGQTPIYQFPPKYVRSFLNNGRPKKIPIFTVADSNERGLMYFHEAHIGIPQHVKR